MNLQQLKYFTASARLKSFTGAAQELYVSQSAITQQIRVLENEVGARLFARSHQGITLTPAGQSLLPRAEKIITLWQEGVQEINTTRLNVGFLGYMQNYLLPAVNRRLKSACPQMAVHYTHVRLSACTKALEAGEIDLLLDADDRRWHTPAFQFEKLCDDKHFVVLSPTHPLAGRASLSLEDLRAYQIAMPPIVPWMDHMEALRALPGGDVLDDTVGMADYYNVPLYVQQHNCVAIMPGYSCPESREIAAIPLVPDVLFPVGAVYKSPLCPSGKLFLEHARQAMEKSI